ncbi:hypothetical protein [Halopiger goleimassiliensis]|uniref:hypothetical protein n=1 Tax=Halopiger goleimassiliensis TaxID=1293048 RepID=UPI000677E6F8|nr:hypothetical protein [Halopiger goleimassiliensis]
MTITFEETAAPPGITIHDSIEQRRLHLETSDPVALESVDTEAFEFPLDRACRFEAEEVTLDQTPSVTIHGATGESERSLTAGETARLTDGVQYIGLSGAIKLYCRVEGPGTIELGMTSVRIAVDRPRTITLGARSLHDRPAATVVTDSSVDSMMEAVSVLSSALKTTSPERTWPTLRGHPPLVELGDRLSIPDELERPTGEVELVVPAEYGAVFTAAPLAFFLEARVRSGECPRLRTPRFEYSLGRKRPLADDVGRLLKRSFFLDCLARTEGVYQYDLHERSVLEDDLPFDLAETYERSLPERLERYLEVPYDRLEPHMPRWPLTAHVPADPEGVELLPFIANELGIVREANGRTPDSVPGPEPANAQLVRSAAQYRSSPSSGEESTFVTPTGADESVEQAWFGDGIPTGASKATIEAYRNQLDRDPRSESIEILLVCNDARMIEEHDLLDEAYGNREELPFEIHSEFGVDTDRMATLLADGGYDFLHYIGHATEDGLECPDGDLDIRSLESVDLGVFFLNACRSYEQGLALTRRGAYGGVSTYSDVINDDAVEAGETLARLLNRGFPLRGALEIAREYSTLGDQYLIVGDGSADIAQSDGGAPAIIELTSETETKYEFSSRSYSTKEYKLGTATATTFESVLDRHLTPGRVPPSRVSRHSLLDYLTWTEYPIRFEEQLYWNDGIGIDVLD